MSLPLPPPDPANPLSHCRVYLVLAMREAALAQHGEAFEAILATLSLIDPATALKIDDGIRCFVIEAEEGLS